MAFYVCNEATVALGSHVKLKIHGPYLTLWEFNLSFFKFVIYSILVMYVLACEANLTVFKL